KNNRVVLAELFTCSQASPAVATSMAMSALLRTFKPTDVAVVSYHMHFPQPHPLGCPEAEERARFYDKAAKRLPVMLLDGNQNAALPGGGGPEDAQERYDGYAEAVEALLEDAPQAQLSVSATRKGDTVIITADVSKVQAKEDVRLR